MKRKKITTVNSMKYGWCQAVNNVVCYFQTQFNIALILDKASNYNNMLRENEKIDKSEHRIQHNMSSDENI